jgi:hypothetical protein
MEQILSELVARLEKAHTTALVSVVLYGSAAADEGKDQQSDFNVLCVLRQVRPMELEASEPIFRWWREKRNPSPLLLSVEEVRASTDCFPIEFHDMKERHRILYGEDVIASLEIHDVFYRAQVEYELRTKLLRLRQKAAGMLSESDLLLRLMVDSVSTFCVLFRHGLRLMGEAPRFGKREVVENAQRRFDLDPQPFYTLIELREEKIKPKDVRPKELFPRYLDSIQIVVDAVNRIGK